MTNDKKPDGWVAWHPEKGILEYYISAGFLVSETVDKAIGELEDDYAMEELFRHYRAQEIENPMAFTFIEWANNAGWRIRPVKIVFLDEEK